MTMNDTALLWKTWDASVVELATWSSPSSSSKGCTCKIWGGHWCAPPLKSASACTSVWRKRLCVQWAPFMPCCTLVTTLLGHLILMISSTFYGCTIATALRGVLCHSRHSQHRSSGSGNSIVISFSRDYLQPMSSEQLHDRRESWGSGRQSEVREQKSETILLALREGLCCWTSLI